MPVNKSDVLKVFAEAHWIENIRGHYVYGLESGRMFRPVFSASLYSHRGALRVSGGFGVFCAPFEAVWRRSISAEQARDDRGMPMSVAIENWAGSVLEIDNLRLHHEEDARRALSEIEKIFVRFPNSDREFRSAILESGNLIDIPVNSWFHLENPLNHTNLYSVKSIAFLRFLLDQDNDLFQGIWRNFHEWQRAVLEGEFEGSFGAR